MPTLINSKIIDDLRLVLMIEKITAINTNTNGTNKCFIKTSRLKTAVIPTADFVLQK
jgi:hypothetical protein